MSIKQWPAGDRPREKLLTLGAETLSDTELLAILLRTGMAGMSALDLARALLSKFGSLRILFSAPRADVESVPGCGSSRFAELHASLELSRRLLREQLANRDAMTSPEAVKSFLRLTLQTREHEVFLAIFLDAQNKLVTVEELFQGTLTQTAVFPREIVKRALAHNAASIIFAHNHPSGLAEPSHADEALTRALKQSLALIDVKVLDHFIVAGATTLSFSERGLL